MPFSEKFHKIVEYRFETFDLDTLPAIIVVNK